MPAGIYALYWYNKDLIYIGQAQDLHRRKLEHFRLLKNNTHTNYKVQSAYNLYGLPEFIIIETTDISNLNSLEVFWQQEFNSINSLDIISAGIVGRGPLANNSKYTKFKILKVFSCLYKNSFRTQKSISNRCKVEHSLVNDIYKGNTHLWLKEEYPEQYAIMQSIDYKSQAYWGTNSKKYKTLMSPDRLKLNVTESVLNLSKQIQLGYYPDLEIEVIRKGIGRVLSGCRQSWRGWTLLKY